MNEKVTRFPITYSERRKNMVGPLCVECQVSGRYLRFHEKSDIVQAGEFITVDVMAMQMDEDTICCTSGLPDHAEGPCRCDSVRQHHSR